MKTKKSTNIYTWKRAKELAAQIISGKNINKVFVNDYGQILMQTNENEEKHTPIECISINILNSSEFFWMDKNIGEEEFRKLFKETVEHLDFTYILIRELEKHFGPVWKMIIKASLLCPPKGYIYEEREYGMFVIGPPSKIYERYVLSQDYRFRDLFPRLKEKPYKIEEMLEHRDPQIFNKWWEYYTERIRGSYPVEERKMTEFDFVGINRFEWEKQNIKNV